MNQSQAPSLLEYARFHGIATNQSTINPLEYINQILEIPIYEDTSTFDNHLSTTHAAIEQGLRKEKLNVSKNDARFLSTVVRNARAERVDVNWDEHLPSMRRIEGLKVELPALMTHHETDMASLRKHTLFGRGGAASSLLKGLSPYPLADCSGDVVKMGEEVVKRVRMERLNCTKGSFIMIQNARRCGDGLPRDMESYFDTLLRPYQRRSFKPDTPFHPIEFDDLHSPPPTPKPQMLPIPVPSDPFELHELQCALPETESSVSRSLRTCDIEVASEELRDESPSMIQSGEELGLSNKAISEETYKEEQDTGSVYHRSSIDYDPFISHGERTCSKVVLSPEKFHTHCQSISSPTLQSTLPFDSQEPRTNGYNELSLFHSKDNGSQNLSGETHPDDFFEPQDKTHLENRFDNDGSESTQRIDAINPTLIKQKDNSIIENYSSQKPMTAEVTVEKTVSCGQQSPGNQLPIQKQKRKNARKDPIPRKKRRKYDRKGITSQRQPSNKDSALSSPFTALGSLSSFMETRGKPIKREANATSPYFQDNGNRSNDSRINEQMPKPDITTETPIEPENQNYEQVNLAPTIPSHHIPQCPPRDTQEPPLLFLSTSLLKTHRGLVRILESMNHPSLPTLIYRDYDYNKEPPRTSTSTINKSSMHDELQHEADIIISPSTGILLTTSQATTQLYLPGHKPSHPQLDKIKGFNINSPLRERIILLAPRYEQLYIFICHAGGPTKKQLQPQAQGSGKATGPTADKRTLASITSLMAFCSSASKYSTLTPLLITPSASETVAEWILSLASKHSFELPQSISMKMERSTIGFTPINPNKNGTKKVRLDPACMETETQWELFLRRAGLNPFAAQVLLAVMREEGDGPVDENAPPSDHAGGMKVSALSRFIEMSTEHRRRLLADLVGDRVLKRIDDVVDNDWQCDWALNFDAFR